MKLIIIPLLLAVSLLSCSRGSTASGADVVNTGSIFGKLLDSDNTMINDSVTVTLYKEDSTAALAKGPAYSDTFPRILSTSDGDYRFDSLPEGGYRIEVTRNGIIIGEKRGITLEKNDSLKVDITVFIIINQTFNIWNTNNSDNSKKITINQFFIENGSIEKSDSGYTLTTAENDTLVFEIEIEQDDTTSTVTVRIIRNNDGSSSVTIINNDDDVKIAITPGAGLATGQVGEITVHLKEPGTIEMESDFDTSGVPEKSK